MSQFTDYYRVLQVSFGAPKEVITASYRRLSKLYHPDINRAPGAEIKMKSINAAYHVLKSDERRHEYDTQFGFMFGQKRAPFAEKTTQKPPDSSQSTTQSSAKSTGGFTRAHAVQSEAAAQKVMENYLNHLLDCEYEKAYQLLCLYDKQYVTLQSFCKWRESAQKLFAMRSFDIAQSDDVPDFMLEAGIFAPARKLYVNVNERNFTTNTTEKYQFTKHVVLEYGVWKVFLGYRDLGEIARLFEDMSVRQEQGDMARHWEEYCRNTCRGMDMLSAEGLIKEGARELYRCRRYGQSMTVAAFSVRGAANSAGKGEDAGDNVVGAAAQTLTAVLRETDTPAYIGSGVFIVLFVEMRKRSAQTVIRRIAEKIARGVESETGRIIAPRFSYLHYTSGELQDYIDKLPAMLEG